jgi:hypothetical protein
MSRVKFSLDPALVWTIEGLPPREYVITLSSNLPSGGFCIDRKGFDSNVGLRPQKLRQECLIAVPVPEKEGEPQDTIDRLRALENRLASLRHRLENLEEELRERQQVIDEVADAVEGHRSV